jgi:hypothetical protein
LAEILVDNDVEYVVDATPPFVQVFPAMLPVLPTFPMTDVLEDLYVCVSCGSPLTEIPTYNRFYCENCGLHY